MIGKKHVRDFALFCAGKRAHRFKRVGAEFYVRCESQLRAWIESYVKRLPSKGKTIK